MADEYEPKIEGIEAIPEGDREAAELEHKQRKRTERRDLATVFRSVGSWEWLDTEPPEPRPLVTLPDSGAPWLPRGKTAMLAAPGGTGKSQALIQLALCVACVDSDRKWLGHFTIPPEARGPVVLALGEEGAGDMHRRIINALDVLGYTEAEREAIRRNLYALPLAGRPSALLDEPARVMRTAETRAAREGRALTEAEEDRAALGYTEQVKRWRQMLERPPELGDDSEGVQWRAVILDPASRFIGPGAEKDNAVATRFVEILEGWALKQFDGADIGPTVLFAHHVKKSASTDPKTLLFNQGAARGSSGLTDGVRWQANMAADTFKERGEKFDVVGLNVVKINDGPAGEPMFLKRLEHGVLKHDPHGAAKFYDDGDGSGEERFANTADSDGGDYDL